MNKKHYSIHKSGFSLAELLIVLAMLGVLIATAMTLSMPMLKNTTRYQYINAYNSLSTAYYNGLLKGFNPFDDASVDDGVTPVHSKDQDTGTEILCRCLTNFINTNDNTRYTKTVTYEDGTTKSITQDYSASCSDTAITTQLANDFSNRQFIANNGMIFYISNKLGDDNFPFYIVYIDINGNSPPNSINYTESGALPDIFAFAMLNTGRVIPIGVAEYDENVLSARIAYFNADGDTLFTRRSLAYYQAKGAAWGYYSGKADNLDYNETEPFTMNDFVRSKLDPESNILNPKNFAEAFTSPVTVNDGTGCSIDDYESCYVFLDAYKQF